MRGVNQATIIGNLGRDPEPFNGGCRLAVATDESYKDKNTGQMVPRTEWHNVTVFGKLAEICTSYLNKGSKVFLQGRLQTDSYDKDGVKHYQTKIIADNMRMLDSKPEGQQRAPQAAPQPVQAAPAPVDDFDDPIPF